MEQNLDIYKKALESVESALNHEYEELKQIFKHSISVIKKHNNVAKDIKLVTSDFLEELEKDLHKIAHFKIDGDEDIQARVFSFIESVAVVAREVVLRTCKKADVTEEEKKLFHYFEKSGQWKYGDGNMVTDYYYTYVPVAVIRDHSNITK